MQFIRASILLVGFGIHAIAYAAIAPVVDAYDDINESVASETSREVSGNHLSAGNGASFSLDQRMTIVERQVANLNPLIVQIDDFKQQLQGLQGRVDEQQHCLKRLEEQIRSQYQALEQRVAQGQVTALESLSGKSSTAPSLRQTEISALKKAAARPATKVGGTGGSSTPLHVPTAAGERAYQTAFQLLKDKQYIAAIQSFENFAHQYPHDVNRPNANYFLGQLYLLQGQPDQSIATFNRFIKTSSLDARVPDALLQLGLAYFAKGEKNTAMETFKKIMRQYPDSKAAQSAQARLQQFQAMVSVVSSERDHA